MSTSSSDNIIEMRNVSVSFDMERGESRVLDNVTFNINRDELLGVVGESGSGKSMFASALLDAVVDPGHLTGEIIYHPQDGESIDILGLSDRDLKRFRWEEISMVFQGAMSSFNPTMKIREHFVETVEAHNADHSESMDLAYELLEDLYLDPDRVLDSYPHELSGGMQQRALVALSLVLEPEVLVMDEPTAALDLLMQQSILTLLEDIQEKYDITLVFITHDLPLVVEIADRLTVMYAFQFVEVGPTEEIVWDPAHPYTRSLLKAVPNLGASVDMMKPIDGSSPDPVNAPEGCSYHPRCPLADEECVQTDPGFLSVTDQHDVACFHWESAENAVPIPQIDTEGDT